MSNEIIINEENKRLDPTEINSQIFKKLLKREQEVLRRRFALHGKEKDTLEQIGKEYAITRERVRQIEASGLRKIKAIIRDEREKLNLGLMESTMIDLLGEHGGVMREDLLITELLYFLTRVNNEIHRKNLLFLMEYSFHSHEKLLKSEENIFFEPFWYLSHVDISHVKNSVTNLVEFFERYGGPLTFQELLAHINEKQVSELKEIFSDAHSDAHKGEKYFLSHLHISKKLEQNILSQWGLVNWNTIVPRRMNDKIYLVLKRESKPLHFSEIAQKINEMGFDKKLAYPATVHNELILDNKYILVGRGVYALREWGYNDGTVSEVILDILKHENRPLDKKEIIEKVLKQRMVKKTTVALALNDKMKFKMTDDEKYIPAQ